MATRKLKVAWDGIFLEYSRFDCAAGLFVSLAIAETKQSCTTPSHLHLMLKPTLVDPQIAQQIQSVPVPLNYGCEVKDSSIVHLIELLQIEMQSPKQMSRMYLSSIVLVLVTHLLQQWKVEQLDSPFNSVEGAFKAICHHETAIEERTRASDFETRQTR